MRNLGILAGNMPTEPLAKVLGRAGLTPEDVVKNTESFAFLALTYLSLWEEKGGGWICHVGCCRGGCGTAWVQGPTVCQDRSLVEARWVSAVSRALRKGENWELGPDQD